eukprot:246956-Amphidinium_carterae.1
MPTFLNKKKSMKRWEPVKRSLTEVRARPRCARQVGGLGYFLHLLQAAQGKLVKVISQCH